MTLKYNESNGNCPSGQKNLLLGKSDNTVSDPEISVLEKILMFDKLPRSNADTY